MRNKVKTNFKLGIYCRDIELYPYVLSSYWMKKGKSWLPRYSGDTNLLG